MKLAASFSPVQKVYVPRQDFNHPIAIVRGAVLDDGLTAVVLEVLDVPWRNEVRT